MRTATRYEGILIQTAPLKRSLKLFGLVGGTDHFKVLLHQCWRSLQRFRYQWPTRPVNLSFLCVGLQADT